jgi:hypothetical protein
VFLAQSQCFQHEGQCRIEYGLLYEWVYVFAGFVCWGLVGHSNCAFFSFVVLSFLVFVLDGDCSFFVCVDGDVHGSQEAWRSTELAFESLFWVDQVMVIVRYVR